MDIPVRLWTDSSAAIGICSRQGLGNVRHLDTYTLWVQQAVRNGRIHLKKVKGEANPADVFTKHSLTRDKLRSLTELFDCYFRDGRAEAAPLLRRSKTTGNKISEADGDVMAVCDANQWAEGILNPGSEDTADQPCMPHLIYDQDVIEAKYPSLRAPAQLDVDDAQQDAWDHIYQKGLREAQDIAADMRSLGRMKYARHRPTASATKEPEGSSEMKTSVLRSPGVHTGVAV